MSQPVLVQIIGAPIACADGVKDSWRETAHWAAGQLKIRFGDMVETKYFDLFEADCPSLPVNAQLPVVLVNSGVVSIGGKISIPLIRRKVEEIILLEKA